MTEHGRPTPSQAWETGFARLSAYAAEHGHARPPHDWRCPETQHGTGKWCQNQRQRGRRGTMPPELAARLESLPGWSWNTVPSLAAKDAVRRAEQAEQAARGGSADLSTVLGLAAWLATATPDVSRVLPRHPDRPGLRAELLELRVSRERLGPAERVALERVPGWAWDCAKESDACWRQAYDLAVRWAARHGSLPGPDCPERTEDGRLLGWWVVEQARLVATGRSRPHREKALDALPRWRQAVWQQRPSVLARTG